MDFTPGREVVHVRQDLQATKEILALVQDENRRLRVQVQDLAAKGNALAREMEEARAQVSARVNQAVLEVQQSRQEQQRLETELSESLSERQRLSQVLRDVRSQVDGRLTKLVGELQTKDEAVHKLEYKLRETERERDRLLAAERALISKEQTADGLSAQLARLRDELQQSSSKEGQLRTDLAVMKEKLDQAVHAAAEHSTHASTVSHEALAILPLYRDWVAEMEKELLDLEDFLEGSLDQCIDAQGYLRGNGGQVPVQDRQRLAELRRIERERIQRQSMLLSQAAGSFDDALAITVQAIRTCWDTTRFTLTKVKASARQLHVLGGEIVDRVRQRHPRGTTERARAGVGAIGSGVAYREGSTSSEEEKEASGRLRDAARVARLEAEHARLVMEKDLAIDTLRRQLADATSASSVAAGMREAALEAELRRKEEEIRRLLDTQSALEGDVRQARSDLQRARDAAGGELSELHHKAHLQEERAQQLLRETTRGYEDKVRDLQDRMEDLRSRSAREIADLRKEITDAQYREEKLSKVVEESREKRLGLKQQRDALAEELRQQKALVVTQHRELNESQQVIESLRYELSRQEATRREEEMHRSLAHASAAARPRLHDDLASVPDTVFRSWKREQATPRKKVATNTVVLLPGAARR